jgi:hypothetical protein
MPSDWNSTGISKRFMNELKRYCSTNPSINKVVLFGSRARGDYERTSDIDLALSTNHLTHSQQNLIEEDIHEMPTPLKIDIVFMDRLSKQTFISNIMKDGVVVYEQRKAARKA